MAFITPDELKTVAYSYQVSEITEADNDIVLAAIAAGTKEVQGYLRPNNKKEYIDGRYVYDVAAVFGATGTNRDDLILQYTKIVSLWHLLILCNADIIYEHVKERYDRVVDYLKKVNKGDITLDLPTVIPTEDESNNTTEPFRFGSRKKFRHE
jgi:phage gp36-like protein